MAWKQAAAMVIGMTLASGAAPAASPDNTLIMELKENCRVTIELLPQVAPQHVARIKELAQSGFYDGLVFHRVIDGFMAQTGDPLGNGTGGSGKKLPAEFSKEPFVRGTVGMARSGDPNSGDSQFFIMFAPAPHLDGQYTVWGKVTEGMTCIDQVKKGDPRRNGEVAPPPDKIVRMRLASDTGKK